MSCPYSEEELQVWDSVANPMGEACYHCFECDCEHWAGTCEGCPHPFTRDHCDFFNEDSGE